MEENLSPEQARQDASETAFRAVRQHVIETFRECKAATGDAQSALQLTSMVLAEAHLTTAGGYDRHLLLSSVTTA
jgi:hypothetical protein